MLALSLGLTAALIWAVHDLMARKLSQGAALLPIVLLVLVSGSAVLLAPSLVFGDWTSLSVRAALLSCAAGLTFALAIGTLYRAFSMAPARIVSPIIGAYPIISLALAVAQGRPVTLADWVAVVAVVAGISVVSLTAGDEATSDAPPKSQLPAMGWSFLSACGFAATFAIGQEAARQASELPTILMTRLSAVFVIGVLFLWTRSSLSSLRGNWVVLAVMGAFDAVALSLVTASGSLPRAEYASVSSSLFGVGTILLASYFLNEKLRLLQWVGVAAVFGGIATLSLQG
jgi:drug/metabolite transporter (DMT)-like permease